MKNFIIIVLAAVSFLGGCVSTPERTISANDAQQISQNVRVKQDEFQKQTEYIGPTMSFGMRAGDVTETKVFLRAYKKNDNTISYQIYVRDFYKGRWRLYDRAFDKDGNKFDVVVIDRTVDSCNVYCYYYEDVGIDVTADYLNAHTQSGTTFKVAGNGGEVIFSVPGPYIEGFLKATNAPV